MCSIAGLRPVTFSHKHGQHWLYHMWFFSMKPLLVENVIGYKCHWMRNSLGWKSFWMNVHWMKLRLDQSVSWMKSILDESVFYPSRASRPDWARWKKEGWDPICHVHVDLQQRSVDNRIQTEQVSFWRSECGPLCCGHTGFAQWLSRIPCGCQKHGIGLRVYCSVRGTMELLVVFSTNEIERNLGRRI